MAFPQNISNIKWAIIKLLFDKNNVAKLIKAGIYNSNRYKDIFVLIKYMKIYLEILR